jgi:hypothetical protein
VAAAYQNGGVFFNSLAHAQRFVRSIKEECLERKIFFGENSLRTAVHEYSAHYHAERNHQGWTINQSSPYRPTRKHTGRSSASNVSAAPSATITATARNSRDS